MGGQAVPRGRPISQLDGDHQAAAVGVPLRRRVHVTADGHQDLGAAQTQLRGAGHVVQDALRQRQGTQVPSPTAVQANVLGDAVVHKRPLRRGTHGTGPACLRLSS